MGLIAENLWVIGRRARRRVSALFDTGSSDSLIRADLAGEIGHPDELPEPKKYRAAVGSFVVRTSVVADVLLAGKRFTALFFVVPGLTEELVLGADFMQRWHLRLEPRRRRVILDPKALQLKAVWSARRAPRGRYSPRPS